MPSYSRPKKVPLTTPSSLPSGTTVTDTEFSAPAGSALAKNTRYWVVIESTAGAFKVSQTRSYAEDSGHAANWCIGNAKRSRTNSQTWGQGTSDSTLLKIAVKGRAKGSPDQDETPIGGLYWWLVRQ